MIEYIMLISLFVILIGFAFVKFQDLLYSWFKGFIHTVWGPTV